MHLPSRRTSRTPPGYGSACTPLLELAIVPNKPSVDQVLPARLAVAAVVAVLVASGCSADVGGDDGGRLEVVAAFYPYAYLAERIGGPDVDVRDLTRAGAEPHDLELSPRQVGAISTADLVVYSDGFQPAVDDAVDVEADGHAFDVNDAVDLVGGYVPLEDGEPDPSRKGADPHVWLDPVRYAQIGEALAARLGQVRPAQAPSFTERAQSLTRDLTALDADLRRGLSSCRRKEVVTSHNAFGYLTARYGLTQVAVTGLVPEQEPTPRRLAEVAALARERGVTTVFFEELVSPRTAKSLAREVGAKAEVLSPLEGKPRRGDYLTAMRTNLATLRTALDCA